MRIEEPHNLAPRWATIASLKVTVPVRRKDKPRPQLVVRKEGKER